MNPLSNSKKTNIYLVILVFFAYLFLVTNPSENDHKERIEQAYKQIVGQEGNSKELTKIFEESLGISKINSAFKRENYYLFSFGHIGDKESPALTYGFFATVYLTEGFKKKLSDLQNAMGSKKALEDSVKNVKAVAQSEAETKIVDTIDNIKGKCFLYINTFGAGRLQQQFRRVVSFHESNQTCQYLLKEASANRGEGPELDGRTIGRWKKVNDKIIVNWDAFYIGSGRDTDNDKIDDNTGVDLRVKRVIESVYGIEVSDNELKLTYVNERVISIDTNHSTLIDQYHVDDAYRIVWNKNMSEKYFARIECEDFVTKYMKRDFYPQKNESDRRIDASNAEYNRRHTCSDQQSFDAGYDVAREQIGSGLVADADYLFKVTPGNLNYYCFKRGVEQYIFDQKQ